MSDTKKDIDLSCPLPNSDYPNVVLAHGGGGTLMHELISKLFYPSFENPLLSQNHDSTVFPTTNQRFAITTDSYVVRPLIFPGGDIGKLSICGTVNDLAMCGARPVYLSVGFILEEGLPMEILIRIVQSMKQSAKEAGTEIITGDTKVVEKNKGDGVFINTTGLGVLQTKKRIHPLEIQPGDQILINGDIGRHGISIMALREGLEFENTIQSDTAAVHELVLSLLKEGIEVHCLRDATRGGVASVLNEIANEKGLQINIQEQAIPIHEDVQGACELLGLEPLHVANEGKFLAFVAAMDSKRALEILRNHPLGKEAAVIGEVSEKTSGVVTLESSVGTKRIVPMLSGETLPRIC